MQFKYKSQKYNKDHHGNDIIESYIDDIIFSKAKFLWSMIVKVSQGFGSTFPSSNNFYVVIQIKAMTFQ